VTPITRVVTPYMVMRGGRPVAVFRLSEIPDETWIMTFRERAVLSHFDPFSFKFSGEEIAITPLSPMELSDLKAAVDRFMRGANIDTGRT